LADDTEKFNQNFFRVTALTASLNFPKLLFYLKFIAKINGDRKCELENYYDIDFQNLMRPIVSTLGIFC